MQSAGASEELRTSEYDERKKKGWKRCDCPIFVSGTLNRKFAPSNHGPVGMGGARALAAKLKFAVDGVADPVPSHPEP